MSSPRRGRLYELDFLRLVAAMSVVLFHYTYRGARPRGIGGSPYIALRFPEIDFITRYGFLGVQLFFFLSGMVILRSARGVDVRRFVASRVARIYPAFWVLCTVSAVAIVWTGFSTVGPRAYAVNMTMMAQFLHVDLIDGVYWTLAVELRFYLLIALAVIFRLTERMRVVLPIWLGTIFVVARLHVPDAVTLLTLTDYGPYFVAGCCCYLLSERRKDLLLWATLAAALFLSCARALVQAGNNAVEYGDRLNRPVVVLVVLIAAVLVLAASLGLTARFGRPWMVAAGALTYPLYIVHQNLGYIALHALGSRVNKWVALVVVIAAMLALATAVNRLVERPLGHRLRALVLRVLLVRPGATAVGYAAEAA